MKFSKDSQKPPRIKLTREQIREGLNQVPLETLLLGPMKAKESKLSAKDREFARQLALGNSKAESYRRSRPTKAKPASASRKGQALAKLDAIKSQKEAFELAMEVERLSTPAQLRALVISQLTAHAISEDNTAREKLTALKLLGSVTEVAAFTHRTETVKVTDPGELRTQLLASIRSALKSQALTVEDTSGDELLAELATVQAAEADTIDAPSVQLDQEPGPEGLLDSDSETIPGGDPPKSAKISAAPLLSNPHFQSSPESSEQNALTQPTKGQDAE